MAAAPLNWLLKIGGETLKTTAKTLSEAVNTLHDSVTSLSTTVTNLGTSKADASTTTTALNNLETSKLNVSDLLSLEEIEASTLLTGKGVTAESVKSLNSSLTKVRTYVNEEDGKIHFVDSTGADSVLPFSGKAYPYGSVGSVSGSTRYTGDSGYQEFAENTSTIKVPKNTKSIRFDFYTSSSSGATTVSILSFTLLPSNIKPVFDSGWINGTRSPAVQHRRIFYDDVPEGTYTIKIKAGYASSQTSSLNWQITSNAVVSTQPDKW